MKHDSRGKKKITSKETTETQSCLPKEHLDYELVTRNVLASAGKDFGDTKRKTYGVVRQGHARGGSMEKSSLQPVPTLVKFQFREVSLNCLNEISFGAIEAMDVHYIMKVWQELSML